MKRSNGSAAVLGMVVLFAASGALSFAASEAGAVVPEAPKVSTFAPAKDLTSQVTFYLGRLEESVATPEEYNDAKDKIVKDANTMIVIALALGLHDEDNAYKNSASAMIKAAQDLANAKDHAAAKAAFETLKKSSTGNAGGADRLKWEKTASLKALMAAVPNINTKLKRFTKGSRLKSKAKDTTGFTAVLAVIAQASFSHSADTLHPEKTDEWYKECQIMRDAAAEVNQAIHAGDAKAVKTTMKKLADSCETCHEVFKPGGVIDTEDDDDDD